MHRTLTLLTAVLCAAAVQAAPNRSVAAARLQGTITMDGRLDEAAWKSAPAVTGFLQDSPTFGQPSNAPTEVHVLYDDQYLYVGARMTRAPNSEITALVHRRDENSFSDWFSVALDSLHDRRTALMFMVNAAGVQRDLVLLNDTASDTSWDAVWLSAASVDAGGWSCEMKIPFSLFRIRAGQGPQTWGINFTRRQQTPYELSRYYVVPRGENAFVSRFPDLTGLSDIKPQRRTEFMPYASTVDKVRTAERFDDLGPRTKLGLDAHFGLGGATNLDVAANPDYGQAEVDETVLNLSTIETFFPEKRPFFLDGTEIFQVAGPQLFYSRRIGAGLGYPNLNQGETLVSRPLASDILGAAKLTTKQENGLNFGVLAAVTRQEDARINTPGGDTISRTVGNQTGYGVARGLQQIGTAGSYIGMFTSFVDEGSANGRRANVDALDGVFKSQDRTFEIDALGAFSRAGRKSADLLDGEYARVSGVKRWRNNGYLAGAVTYASRTFDPHDLGYLPRPDFREYRVEGGRQWDSTWKMFRNWGFYSSATYATDTAGMAFNRNVDGRFSTELKNSWKLYIGGGAELPVDDDLELRTFRSAQKRYLHLSTKPYITAGFQTSGSGLWYTQVDVSRALEAGGPSDWLSVSQTIRPTSRLELGVSTSLNRNAGSLRWLETHADGTPIVGYQRLSELSEIARASYAFTPHFTLQAFTQFLVANWSYRDLRSYVSPNVLAPGATAAGSTAFSDRSWNVNLIARWEFLPGSALYAIYTKGTSTGDLANVYGGISPMHDLPYLFHQPANDALQLKISWMFN